MRASGMLFVIRNSTPKEMTGTAADTAGCLAEAASHAERAAAASINTKDAESKDATAEIAKTANTVTAEGYVFSWGEGVIS